MRIETERIQLELDGRTGVIKELRSALTGWSLQRRGEVALSWKLLVPLGERRRDHWVLGEQQRLTRCERSETALKLIWEQPVSQQAGPLDIRVTMTYRSDAGRILLETQVENNSPYVVESVLAPCLGELRCPEQGGWLKGFLPNYNGASRWELYPKYQNFPGYYGLKHPTQYSPWSGNLINPSTPFFLVETEGQGFYFGMAQPNSQLAAFTTELCPGYQSGLDSLVPMGEEIGGKPVAIRFSVAQMPYLEPGQSAVLPQLAIDCYQGDWEAGARLYQRHTASRIKTATPPAWAQEPHTWQQIQMNSPEDELRFCYRELPRYAEECVKNNVKVIQLVGWNWGGQDRGNPYHGVDPELGTEEELREAIEKCHALGVKIVLFAKFIWADRGSDWYREELQNLAVRDPNGEIYAHPGFKYLTPTQLLNINPRRFAAMCFASERYRAVCREQFLQMAGLGCDGILIDECLYHGPALLCFDTSHGHRRGQPVYEHDRQMLAEFRQAYPERELLFAGEGCYDLELEEYHMIYTRTFSKDHVPLTRLLFPKAQIMTAVTGFRDRNQINQCLLYRYLISYEPYCFKGELKDFPDTVAYGNRMEAFRQEYRRWLWDGEFLGHGAYRLKPETPCGEDFQYSAYRAEDGSTALLLVNYGRRAAVRLRLPEGFSSMDDVDTLRLRAAGELVEIAPESAVLLLP